MDSLVLQQKRLSKNFIQQLSDPLKVSFDLATLNKMAALSKGGKGTNIILGLPLWAFYYTVFDITGQSVSFVPQKSQQPPALPAPEAPSTTPPAPETPWPIGPFTGPDPWAPIPGHQPGSWPAPQGGSWPVPEEDPLAIETRGDGSLCVGGLVKYSMRWKYHIYVRFQTLHAHAFYGMYL